MCSSPGMHSAGRRKRKRATGSWSPVMHVPQSMSVCLRDPCDLRCPAGVHLYGGVGGVGMLYPHAHTPTCPHRHTLGNPHQLHSLLVLLGEGEEWTKTWSLKPERKTHRGYKWQNRTVQWFIFFVMNRKGLGVEHTYSYYSLFI